jgi:hypothetical protein
VKAMEEGKTVGVIVEAVIFVLSGEAVEGN